MCVCVRAHLCVCVGFISKHPQNVYFLNLNAWTNVRQLNLICWDLPLTHDKRPASLFLTHTHFSSSLPPLPSLHFPCLVAGWLIVCRPFTLLSYHCSWRCIFHLEALHVAACDQPRPYISSLMWAHGFWLYDSEVCNFPTATPPQTLAF